MPACPIIASKSAHERAGERARACMLARLRDRSGPQISGLRACRLGERQQNGGGGDSLVLEKSIFFLPGMLFLARLPVVCPRLPSCALAGLRACRLARLPACMLARSGPLAGLRACPLGTAQDRLPTCPCPLARSGPCPLARLPACALARLRAGSGPLKAVKTLLLQRTWRFGRGDAAYAAYNKKSEARTF
jgi:hypothetical protein